MGIISEGLKNKLKSDTVNEPSVFELFSYWKFSFMEVYCRFYSQKLSFMAAHQRSHKTKFLTIKATIYLPNGNFRYGYLHSNAIRQL